MKKPRPAGFLRAPAPFLASLCVLAGGLAGARADTYYWDPQQAAALGGSGTWDLSSPNWSLTNAATAGAVIYGNGGADAATFGGTAGVATIAVGTALNASNLTFGVSGYTLASAAGGSLTLSGAAPTIVGNGTTNLSAKLNGTAGFSLSGGNFNVFSGDLTDLRGTINVGARATLQGVTYAPTGNGATALSGSQFQTWNVTAGNVLTSNNHGVPATIPLGALTGAGTIRSGNDGGGSTAAGTDVFQVGALNTSTVFAGTFIDQTPGNITGLTKVGTGTLTLTAASTGTGGTIVSGGTLALGAGGGAGTVRGLVTINSGATLSLTASDALGYTAGTQITTLNVNGGVVDNATTTGNRNQGFRTSFNLTGGAVTSSGGGMYRFTPADATVPGIASNASAITSRFGGNVDIFTGALGVNVAGGTTPSGVDLEYSGQFSGPGALVKNGGGVLNLTGGSTYAGSTAINAGTVGLSPVLSNVSAGAGKPLQVKSSLGLGPSLANSAITLAPAAALRLAGGDLPVLLGAAPEQTTPLAGNITATGSNSLRVATGATITPGVYPVLSTNQVGLGAGTFQLDGANTLSVPAQSLIKQFGGVSTAGATTGGAFYRLTVQTTGTGAQVVVTPAPANVINILPMGSSTTEGVSSQPEAYSGGGYRSQLYQSLVNDGRFTPNFVGSNTVLDNQATGGYNVLSGANQLHHEGHGGYTSSQVLTSLNYGASWLATNASGQPTNGVAPDYVTLAIGGNDLSISAKSTSPHPIPAADLAAPLNRTDAIVTYIATALRPNAHVIVGTLFYRIESNSGDIEVVGDLQNAYYNAFVPRMVYNHVLAGHHVSMVDLYGAVTPGNNMSQVGTDGIHALTTGYNLMASAFYNALASGSAYWNGGQDPEWSTASFAQNYPLTVPRQSALTPATDVYFNANTGALATTLGQDTAVRGVNFAAGATGPVTVGGAGTLALGQGGITVQAGTGAHALQSKVALSTDQTWGNVSGNPFAVSGVISGNAALTLTASYTIQDQVDAAHNSDAVTPKTFKGAGSFVLSGANLYSGGTTINSGLLLVNNATGSGTGTGGVNVASGAALTDNGSISGNVTVGGTANGSGVFDAAVTVNAGGAFTGPATVNGPLSINNGGFVLLSSGTLTANGGVVNNGTIRLDHGATLAVGNGSTFTNNGTLDIITGSFTAPAGFANHGVVIDSSVVRAKGVTRDSGGITITVEGFSGHAYQLQRSDSLASGAFADLGPVQTGTTGATLTFQDASPATGQGFYRVRVDP